MLKIRLEPLLGGSGWRRVSTRMVGSIVVDISSAPSITVR